MKRIIPLLAQLGLLLVAAFILLQGAWLLAAVIEQQLLIDDQMFTWIDFLLIVFLLFVLYFVVYIGRTIWHNLFRWVKSVVHRLRKSNSVSASAAPETVIRLTYKLDDPSYQTEFNRFLDTPAYINASQHTVTPAQLVEGRMLQLARDINTRYGGKLVVQPSITRSSLDVVFDILGDSWVFLKEYKEFVEVALLIGRQAHVIVDKVNKTYKKKYGRKFVVSDNMEINAKSTGREKADIQGDQPPSSSITPPPVNITNSYVPPQNNRDMHISINASGQRSWGCINTCLLALLLVALVVASFLFLFVNYEERLALLQELVNYVGYLMRVVARWLLQVANTIAPTFTEFY